MVIINIMIALLVGSSADIINTPAHAVSVAEAPVVEEHNTQIREVPFYSQFQDVSAPYWQKRACGVASLAMVVDFYNDEKTSVDTLLEQGRTNGAYITGAGWSHLGLVNLAEQYNLSGEVYDWSTLSDKEALVRIKTELEHTPVIASVHYTFDPQNPIPHLAVITDIKEGTVYYNDPAEQGPGNHITTSQFMSAWKKRAIVIKK